MADSQAWMIPVVRVSTRIGNAQASEGSHMSPWVYNPHVGGVTVPLPVRQRTERRIRRHAETHYGGKFQRLDVRFRGALCYIDAFVDERPDVPLHLCRLRYFRNDDAWSMAFYTYSHEKYEPCMFHNGTFLGTPEEAFDIAAIYLDG
jgi:hypothetical protein